MGTRTHHLRTCEYCGKGFTQHIDHKDSENPAECLCDGCYEAELYEHDEGMCDGDCIICAEEEFNASAGHETKGGA